MGRTNFFYGAMNSGKSSQLLTQAYTMERQGKKVIAFKPKSETRDGEYIVSRALGEKRKAFVIGEDDESLITSIVLREKPRFIFTDETQFFTINQIEELALISSRLEIPVFSYGLLMSYTGEIFDTSKKIIECGFTLHELKMQCDFCEKKSTHHLLYIDGKLIKNGEQYHVGDQEYKSCCYDCYLEKTTMED